MTFEPVSAHVLISAAESAEAVKAAAVREGWRADEVEIGLLRIVELWIDGVVLVGFSQTGRLKSIGAAHFSSNATTPKMNSAPSDEVYCWPLRRCRNRLSIAIIVLMASEKCLHVLRRDEANVMPARLDLPGNVILPMSMPMTATASDADG